MIDPSDPDHIPAPDGKDIHLPEVVHFVDPNGKPEDWLDDELRFKAMKFLQRNDPMFNNLRNMLAAHPKGLSEYAQLECIVLAYAMDREEMVNAGMHTIKTMQQTPAPDSGKRIIMPGEAG